MNKNADYWEKRIANATWKTYNDLESKTRDFLEMYQEASLEISEELYKVAEKMRTSTPTLSDMHKLNRLSKLKKNIENEVRALTEKIESLANSNMEQGFKEVYSNINIELDNTEFAEAPKRVIEQLLRQPWEGGNFSERLWKNSQILASNLNDILTRGLIQGMTVTEMAIQLNNRMNQGFNVAHRLVRTETMHYLNSSALRAYRDAGIKEVQFWAAEDERTCKICGAMHGNKYEVDKAPTPPIHPNCRCTILPVIEERDGYKYDKDGIMIVTDDWKDKHISIPKEYKPFAVIETSSTKNGLSQIDRTLYDKDGVMSKQVHSGAHGNPKLHPYGNQGEHIHIYKWNEDGKLTRITEELSEDDKREHADIVK